MALIRLGRIVGVCMLLQFLAGIGVQFGLLAPVFAAPGFLVNGALHADRLAWAALTELAGGFVAVVVTAQIWPVVREQAPRLAIALVMLTGAGLVASLAEGISVLSIRSLSEAYALAGPDRDELFPALRGMLAEQRNWTHYLNLLAGDGRLLVFLLLLHGQRWLPRALVALVAAGLTLQFGTLVQPLFGGDVNFALLAPLAVSYLALTLWLIVRGFRDHRAAPADAAP